ncbi:unnamed protein product, partial [Candidula unifasciata]
ILELRKEKSRDAARSRRGKENYEFYELAKLLPLPAAITSHYLKLRDFSSQGEPQWTPEGSMGSLDGFAFILGSDGRFLYISETVSIYLGLSQVEMAGSSIFEYVHPQDHTELADQLGMCMVPSYMMVQSPEKDNHKSFSLRMKSTLTKRGVHVKTSGYRVSQGNSNCNIPSTNSNSNSSEAPPLLGMVGMAIALPPPTITELRLELDTFITKLSPDFKVIYCEP